MAKTDRGVAQRYAAKRRKKRLAPSHASVSTTEVKGADVGHDEPELPFKPTTEVLRPKSPERPARFVRVSTQSRPTVASRRPFSSYANEYGYVANDLKRVALTGGGLLLLLVLLSFVLR